MFRSPALPDNASEEMLAEASVDSLVCTECGIFRSGVEVELRQYDGPSFAVRCPMAGKRALEMSLGAADKFLAELLDQHEIAMLQSCGHLSQEDISQVIADFAASKGFILAEMQARFCFWTHLPWSLVQIADPVEAHARAHGARMLQEFDKSLQQEQLHHRLTWTTLSGGSRLRTELEQFVVEQMPLAELHNLRRFVYELRLSPTSERVQEGDHSKVKRYTAARTASAQTVSLVVRQQEIEEVMMGPAGDRQRFIEAYHACRNPTGIAQMFRFERHPRWRQHKRALDSHKQMVKDGATEDAAPRCNLEKLVSDLMYSMDVESRYGAVADHVRKAVKTSKKDAAAGIRKHLAESGQGPIKLSEDIVLAACLRDFLSMVSRTRSGVFSMPSSFFFGQSLTTLTSSGSAQKIKAEGLPTVLTPAKPARRLLEATCSSDDTPHRVYFQIAHTHLASNHHICGTVALQAWFKTGDMGITVHGPVLIRGQTVPDCGVSAQRPSADALSGIIVLRVTSANVRQLLKECWLHAFHKPKLIRYSIPGIDDPHDVLQQMVVARAWHKQGIFVTAADSPEIPTLLQGGSYRLIELFANINTGTYHMMRMSVMSVVMAMNW